MKILLIHSHSGSREILKKHLENSGHVVVHETPSLSDLFVHLVKHRPHAFFVLQPPAKLLEIVESAIADSGLKVKPLWIPSDVGPAALVSYLDPILPSLAIPEPPGPLVRYVSDNRMILLDNEYELLACARKQNTPDANEIPAEHLPAELAIFARQVERALEFHAPARRYLRQVLLIDRGLRVEVAYRAVHSSFKIYWLREHACRWLGVLAHYLPGVNPVYLPPPTPPSLKIDWLPFSSSPENHYAINAILIHGMKPSWMQSLREVLEKKFTGQNEEALLHEALILSGWSALLREIAVAQVRVMDCALRPKMPWYTDGLPNRVLHRATGIFCDFWNLRHLRKKPQYLRPVADGVVVDGIKTPGTLPVVPPFRHFVQALAHGGGEDGAPAPDNATAKEFRAKSESAAAVKFSLGTTVITPNAQSRLPDQEIQTAVQRHLKGDWGELIEDDRLENEKALKEGFRLHSSYRSASGTKFWVITEADRSVTTILLPEDY
jgi:hypothetical protein